MKKLFLLALLFASPLFAQTFISSPPANRVDFSSSQSVSIVAGANETGVPCAGWRGSTILATAKDSQGSVITPFLQTPITASNGNDRANCWLVPYQAGPDTLTISYTSQGAATAPVSATLIFARYSGSLVLSGTPPSGTGSSQAVSIALPSLHAGVAVGFFYVDRDNSFTAGAGETLRLGGGNTRCIFEDAAATEGGSLTLSANQNDPGWWVGLAANLIVSGSTPPPPPPPPPPASITLALSASITYDDGTAFSGSISISQSAGNTSQQIAQIPIDSSGNAAGNVTIQIGTSWLALPSLPSVVLQAGITDSSGNTSWQPSFYAPIGLLAGRTGVTVQVVVSKASGQVTVENFSWKP